MKTEELDAFFIQGHLISTTKKDCEIIVYKKKAYVHTCCIEG